MCSKQIWNTENGGALLFLYYLFVFRQLIREFHKAYGEYMMHIVMHLQNTFIYLVTPDRD